MRTSFPQRLKLALAESDLTLAQLSWATGISEKSLKAYRIGLWAPALDASVALARALNVNPFWLREGLEPKDAASAPASLRSVRGIAAESPAAGE